MIEDLIQEAVKNLSVAEVGRIVSVSSDLKSVDVQPLGQIQFGDLPPVDQPILRNVPIQHLDFGSYRMTIEPIAGAECILIFNNRNLDNLRSSESGTTVPQSARAHDIQDAICLIGGLATRSHLAIKKGITLENGDHFLNLAAGNFEVNCKQFTIKSEAITLDAPMTTITGSIMQGAAAAMRRAVGAITAVFSGSISAQGAINSATDVNAAGVSLKQHTHGGVLAGGANTGAPNT